MCRAKTAGIEQSRHIVAMLSIIFLTEQLMTADQHHKKILESTRMFVSFSGQTFAVRSDVETEMHDVAVLHDVFLAFQPQLAGFF